MDSGDMSEVESNEVQPEEAVAAESEATEPTPQGEATEQSELYIEEEDDQQNDESSNSGMTEAQMRAAWKEERDKRKRKNQELEESKKRVQELEERLSKVEQVALDAAVGKKPEPKDFLDAEEYANALSEYESKANTFQSTKEQKQSQPVDQSNSALNLTEDQEFYAYKSKEELKKHFSDYDEVEQSFDQELQQRGINVDAAKAELIGIASLHGIDYAKALYAFKKVPGMLEKLGQAAQTNNPYAIAQAMKEAAGKVKERKAQPIDTKPEPEVNSSGPVDAVNKAVQKAYEQWSQDRTVDSYKKLQAARKRAKQG